MARSTPRVTIGIPVYNGAATIRETVESVLTQTFDDFEVLIVDNASTDDTQKICETLARSDSRVRYVRNEMTISLNANFSRAFHLAIGEFFRWLGDDDSLNEDYLDACVEVLDAYPDAALVTTYQSYVKDDGSVLYEEYTGPRPSAHDPMARLATMLTLLTGSRLWIDPIYSLIRRSLVQRDLPIGQLRFSDHIFACELAIAGPFVHIPRCLASRGWKPPPSRRNAYAHYMGATESSIRSRIRSSSQRLMMVQVLMVDIRSQTDLDLRQKFRGFRYVGVFGIRIAILRVWRFGVRRIRGRARWDDG